MNKHEEIQDLVSTLNNINYQIAELSRIKETIEPRVAELLQHGQDGSKTYTEGKFKITCKTAWIYSLNKEEYEVLGARLPDCFNPVRTRLAYDLDKSIIRDAEKYASTEELVLMSKMITKKQAKLNVKITAGI